MKTYRVHYIKNDNRCYKRVVKTNSIKEAEAQVPWRLTCAVRINEVGAVIKD